MDEWINKAQKTAKDVFDNEPAESGVKFVQFSFIEPIELPKMANDLLHLYETVDIAAVYAADHLHYVLFKVYK